MSPGTHEMPDTGSRGPDVLVLMSGFFAGGEYYSSRLRERGIAVAESLRPVPYRWLRAVRRVHFKLGLPWPEVWFQNWRRNAAQADLIIVHGADLLIPVGKHLVDRYKNARVIFWLWNPSDATTHPDVAVAAGLEVWSFDRQDCLTYGLQQNSTYSFRELTRIEAPLSFDFSFFGADKGRQSKLEDIAEAVSQLGYSADFSLVGDPRPTRFPNLIRYVAPIPYDELLNRVARSRVIVDIVQDSQVGMTLRPVEALFMGKKLLTNARDVLEAPLYDPSRVFVWGYDDPRRLKSFVESPPVPVPQWVFDYYDFSAWIRRF